MYATSIGNDMINICVAGVSGITIFPTNPYTPPLADLSPYRKNEPVTNGRPETGRDSTTSLLYITITDPSRCFARSIFKRNYLHVEPCTSNDVLRQ